MSSLCKFTSLVLHLTWVRPWTWFLHVDSFFPVFFLINDCGDSLEAAVLLVLELSMRKYLFSKISWSLPHETCPSSDVTFCTLFAEMDSWAFPLVHSAVSSSKFWLPVPYLVKILFLPGFLGKRLIRAAVSICLACLGFWLYIPIIS